MTQYLFYSAQTVPTQELLVQGIDPVFFVILDAPSRGEITFTVSGPNRSGTRGSLWCQTATAPYGYTQTIPLATFYIAPGEPQSVGSVYPLGDLSYYQYFFGNVDQIDGDGLTAATLAMVV